MMNCNVLALLVLVASGFFTDNVSGFSTAVFTGTDMDSSYYWACTNLFPKGHGPAAQTSSSPFTLTVSEEKWALGGNLTLNLTSVDGTTFKGFIIQARSDNENTRFKGTFNEVEGAKKNCDGDAVTHTDATEKESIEIIWTAPMTGPTLSMFFVYTVVQTKDMFWVNQTSMKIEYNTTHLDSRPTGGAAHVTLSSAVVMVMLSFFV